jgi:predicted secreted protein
MPNTTNYNWVTPADTDLVKDGAAAIRSLGTAIDTTVFNNAGAAIAKTIVDAKGDIIAATAADTVSRLAVGANDTVLTADSSTATGLKWAAASGGGMTLISTTSLTGSSVSLTSIPSTYNHLQLIIKNYLPANNDRTMSMQFNSDTNTRYRWQVSGANGQGAFTNSAIQVHADTSGTVASGISTVNIYDYTNTTTWKTADIFSVAVWPSVSTELYVKTLTGAYNQTSAISSIQLLADSTTFTSGTVLLYGVK